MNSYIYKNNSFSINETLNRLGFDGSYRPNGHDVTFLLKQDQIEKTPIQEKECLIQSGKVHYSQMISAEKSPSAEHLKHFNQAMKLGAERMANDIQKLGNALIERFDSQEIVLVSLIRAGVPLGVLLKHHISTTQPCFHYGISIIRDRGIDHAALNAIINEHGSKNIVFVDGWTGKGAISKELTSTLQNYPALFDEGYGLPRLVVLADLGGCAWLSASYDDWLIPSGILGSIVSGLTSRSILLDDVDEAHSKNHCYDLDLWHKCIIYDELKAHDISVYFVDTIYGIMQNNPTDAAAEISEQDRMAQNHLCKTTIDWIGEEYGINNVNLIKPSIAEATRAVLRRVPDRILISDDQDENVQLLLHFAKEHNVPVDVLGSKIWPYKAVTLIKKVSGKE